MTGPSRAVTPAGNPGGLRYWAVATQVESAAGAWQVPAVPQVWQVPQSRSEVQAPPVHSPAVQVSPLPQSAAAAHQRAGGW